MIKKRCQWRSCLLQCQLRQGCEGYVKAAFGYWHGGLLVEADSAGKVVTANAYSCHDKVVIDA
jgi:hypothetical protein